MSLVLPRDLLSSVIFHFDRLIAVHFKSQIIIIILTEFRLRLRLNLGLLEIFVAGLLSVLNEGLDLHFKLLVFSIEGECLTLDSKYLLFYLVFSL